MQQRLRAGFVAAFLAAAVLVLATPAQTRGHWVEYEGYDWWSDCSDLPDPFDFLPAYLGSETPGPIDLKSSVQRGALTWRLMQQTRDKDFGPTRLIVGRWYAGMGADEWPLGSHASRDLRRKLDRFRVVSWEIDGTRHSVDPACVFTIDTDDNTIGFINAFARFTEPGLHAVKITARQIQEYAFFHPYVEQGLTDPLGLDGRRLFLPGEIVGDVIDGDFVHAYEVHAIRDWNDWGRASGQR
jgi:hypothetical protein